MFLFGGGQYYTDSSTDLHLSGPIADLEILPIRPVPQRWAFRGVACFVPASGRFRPVEAANRGGITSALAHDGDPL